MARRVSGEVVIRVNDAEVKTSINGMGKEIRRLRKEINDLDVTDKDYQKNLKRLTGELDTAKKKYGEMKDAVRGVGSETSKLPGILKSVGPMIAATFSVAVLTEFGRQLMRNLEIARKTKQEMSSMTGQTGGRLNDNTSSVMALADTYQQDASEIIKTTNALSKQLKIPFEDAFETIKKGFETGIDLSGEMLENIREYAPFMNEAKVSADEMLKILQLQTKEGVFNDKLIDSVKEASIRIGEGTKPAREAIAGLGINVDELYKKLESGEMSRFDAIAMITGKMEELGDQSVKTRTAMADLFGGAGEDAGYQNLILLQDLSKATENLTAESEEYLKIKQKEFEANKKLNDVWVEMSGAGGMLSNIMVSMKLAAAEILPFLMRGAKIIWDLSGRSQTLTNVWKSLKSIWDSVKKAVDEVRVVFENLLKELGLSDSQINKLSGSVSTFITWIWKKLDVLTRIEKALKFVATGLRIFGSVISEVTRFVSALVMTIRDFVDAIGQIDITKPIQSLNKLKDALLGFSGNKAKVDIQFDTRKAQSEALNAFNELQKILWDKMEAANIRNSGSEPGLLKQAEEAKKNSDKARKEAERAEDAEKKRREQIRKEIEAAEKQFYDNLLKEQRSAQDSRLSLMNDGFAKEKAKIDIEFKRRIEDLRNQIKETEAYQKELREKSQSEYRVGNTMGGADFARLADEQVQIIDEKNATIESLEKIHLLELAQLRVKYDQKAMEERERAIERELMNLETRHNNELKALTDLESAKQLLRDQYGFSDEELQKLRSFEKAKEEITLKQQKETLDKQLELLKEFQRKLADLINAEVAKDAVGIPGLYSAEELDEMIAKYETLGNIISGLGEDEEKDPDAEAKKQLLSGIDLLGFTADDWAMAFDSLDQAETKLQKLAAASHLVRMGFDSMTDALGMFYDAQNRRIQNDLQAYEQSLNRKKTALANQLEQGYISQETYNAKVAKLEADLEKKRAEAEYKQAMNEWKMQMVQAIGAMALGILNSLSYGGPVGIAFAAITAALGAFQISSLAKAKPKKPSFAEGGYTSGLGYRDETGHEVAGTVHAGEYVTPKYLLEDPLIARMTDFIEARRRGMNPSLGRPEDGYVNGGPVTTANSSAPAQGSNNLTGALITAVNRLNDNLEYLQENPLEAKLSRTLETAKVLLDDQEEYKNHRNKNRR